MDFLPDVLDHLGKTPREFGALHAHLESVKADGGSAAATMLFQAAFAPLPPLLGQVRFVSTAADGSTKEHGLFTLPSLESGAVLRMRYRLREMLNVGEVVALVEAAPPPPKSERVRPAWKLHDTFEIPKLSDMQPSTIDGPELNLGRSLAGSLLTGGLFVSVSIPRSVGGSGGSAMNTKTHKARELPKGLVAQVTPEQGSIPEHEEREELWRMGLPLPQAQPFVVIPKPPAAGNAPPVRMRCLSCGFEGEGPEYEKARTCPRCDSFW